MLLNYCLLVSTQATLQQVKACINFSLKILVSFFFLEFESPRELSALSIKSKSFQLISHIGELGEFYSSNVFVDWNFFQGKITKKFNITNIFEKN